MIWCSLPGQHGILDFMGFQSVQTEDGGDGMRVELHFEERGIVE